MRKVLIHRPGGYDHLSLESCDKPVPGPTEVRVRTSAIGVNFADCIVRMGLYSSARKYVGWPITPGFEFAGVVDLAGSSVRDLKPGDPVFGIVRFGAYATHVLAPRDQLFRIPDHLTNVQAACFSVVFLSAWYALFELASAKPGMNILVHSAAGGVGGALLQLGKLAGCRMVGVVGNVSKSETARSLGADEVIVKTNEDLWRGARCHAPEGYDIVLDANGPSTLSRSYDHVAPSGRLVVYGFHSMLAQSDGRPRWGHLAVDYLRTPRFNPLDLTNDNKSIMAFNLSYLFDKKALLGRALEQLLGWLQEGRIVSPPIRTYPLAEVQEAQRALESGKTVGKLALVP